MSGSGDEREPAYIYMKATDEMKTETCGHCEGEIDTADWYPVATETDRDGIFRVYQFCGDDCRDEWMDED